ncbi:MAG: hypothetical protein JW714_02455 [Candidatus Omnitrophica bacterium]|nr:hypothetical protein [Candidatus Omnitrophota bacterium]
MKYLLSILILFAFSLVFAEQEEGAFVYNDRGRRDPFLQLVDEQGRYLSEEAGLANTPCALNLSGILWDAQGGSSALINNEILQVGAAISGYTIEGITQYSVKVSKDGREYILRLSQEAEE